MITASEALVLLISFGLPALALAALVTVGAVTWRLARRVAALERAVTEMRRPH